MELAAEKGMKKNATHTHTVHLWNDDGKTTERKRAIARREAQMP